MSEFFRRVIAFVFPAHASVKADSEFGRFVRDASSAERKKVMMQALRGSIERQNVVLRAYDRIRAN